MRVACDGHAHAVLFAEPRKLKTVCLASRAVDKRVVIDFDQLIVFLGREHDFLDIYRERRVAGVADDVNILIFKRAHERGGILLNRAAFKYDAVQAGDAEFEVVLEALNVGAEATIIVDNIAFKPIIDANAMERIGKAGVCHRQKKRRAAWHEWTVFRENEALHAD
ncbi:hypothetical protein SDC9_176690 [bioreactor metagenome]|uniref:Uncharacterized protein n=1 Tax=bioreactor metagenome TaxID=1076179 RepID=A0A645GTZ3_9ZZZZ